MTEIKSQTADTCEDSAPTKEEMKFKSNVAALLNSPWPSRASTDPTVAKMAKSLAAQLRNWDGWK